MHRLTVSRLFAPSLKEFNAETVTSHILLHRAGFIRQSSAGVFNLLPMAVRVLEKLERIIDDELQGIGCQKMVMPSLIASDLWRQTGRLADAGPELFTVTDRKDTLFVLGPTHEEEVTNVVASAVKSYRQLPLRLYQTGRKFRDEARPRFGLMRGREFIMKDLYTFDETKEGAMATYDDVCGAYERIFQRIGLPFVKVDADTGSIGGSLSHEFQLVSTVGEDSILQCPCGKYAANTERAQAIAAPYDPATTTSAFQTQHEHVRSLLGKSNVHLTEHIRVQLVQWTKPAVPGTDGEAAAETASHRLSLLVLRADHDASIHLLKSTRPEWATLLEPEVVDVKEARVKELLATAESVTWLVDLAASESLAAAGSVVTGHFRIAQPNDLCLCESSKPLVKVKGIEVGHAFYLGDKYSQKMKAFYSSGNGETKVMQMGCFGLGVSRIIAAVVEASHDDAGIVWPRSVAPYQVCIVVAGSPRQADEYAKLTLAAQSLYDSLTSTFGLRGEIVLDDRDTTTTIGERLNHAQLVGYPFVVVVGRSFLKEGKYELQARHHKSKQVLSREELSSAIKL